MVISTTLGYVCGPQPAPPKKESLDSSLVEDVAISESPIHLPSPQTLPNLAARIQAATSETFPSILSECWVTLEDPEREEWLFLTLNQWCVVDPKGAHMFGHRLRMGDEETQTIDHLGSRLSYWMYLVGYPFVIRTWVRIDPPAANASGIEEPDLKLSLLETEARKNPKAIKALLEEKHYSSGEGAGDLIRTFAREQTENAKLAIEEGRIRSNPLLSELAEALIERNPEAALAWAEGLGEKSQDMLREMYEAWARHDPEAALTKSLGIPPSNRGLAEPLYWALKEHARDDAKGAFQWIKDNEASLGSFSTRLVALAALGLRSASPDDTMEALATAFPQAAQPGTSAPKSIPIHGAISEQLAMAAETMWSGGWPNTDPVSAAQTLITHPQGAIRDVLLGLAIGRTAQADQDLAVILLEEALAQGPVTGLVQSVDPRHFATEPSSGVAFAQLLEPEDQESWMNRFIQTNASQQNFAETANTLANTSELPNQPHYLKQLTASWAMDDPQSTTVWIESLKEGPARDAALEGLQQTLDKR